MRPLLLLTVALLSACAHPRTLQASHGSAFEAAMALQADRGRPTVASAAYSLTGVEGLEVRARATEKTTEAKSGEGKATETFAVE